LDHVLEAATLLLYPVVQSSLWKNTNNIFLKENNLSYIIGLCFRSCKFVALPSGSNWFSENW